MDTVTPTAPHHLPPPSASLSGRCSNNLGFEFYTVTDVIFLLVAYERAGRTALHCCSATAHDVTGLLEDESKLQRRAHSVTDWSPQELKTSLSSS